MRRRCVAGTAGYGVRGVAVGLGRGRRRRGLLLSCMMVDDEVLMLTGRAFGRVWWLWRDG